MFKAGWTPDSGINIKALLTLERSSTEIVTVESVELFLRMFELGNIKYLAFRGHVTQWSFQGGWRVGFWTLITRSSITERGRSINLKTISRWHFQIPRVSWTLIRSWFLQDLDFCYKCTKGSCFRHQKWIKVELWSWTYCM